MKPKKCTLIKPLQCKQDTNIVDVAKILRREKQRRIIVVDKNSKPIGIISTTDINNRVVADNKEAQKLIAKDIMTSPIFLTCDIEDNLSDIFTKMVKHESFFVPVTKDGKLYGILTYGELISHLKEKIQR